MSTQNPSWSDKNEQKIFKCNAKSATKNTYSLLVIGNTTWSSQLTNSLIEYQENNSNSKMQVFAATSVKSAISTLNNIYADLVIILLDIRKSDCLKEVEMNLLALEPVLLCGRTILVNPRNDLKRNEMGISYENIDNLRRKYHLLIIHGNIKEPINRMFLARGIMTFSNKIINNGIPNIFEFASVDF